MLWLLPYIAWTVGASAVVGAAGYAAVTHFAVVQRILVAVVQRNLRRITDDGEDGAPSYHVERTKTGRWPPEAGAAAEAWPSLARTLFT